MDLRIDAFPSGREIVFLLTQCGAQPCLRGYDIGPLALMPGRPADFYRGTSSEIELTLWQGRGMLEDWWRTAQDAVQ